MINHRPVIFILLVTFLSACNNDRSTKDKSLLPSSSGKFGEVLVVVDTVYENRKTGEVLQQIFYKALDGMPQQEAQFRASTVSHKGFQNILKRSRNILKLYIGKNKKTAINIENDVWAKDQLLIQITAASDEDAARILSKNIQTIRDYFNTRELTRLQKQNALKPEKTLMKKMKQDYQVSLTVPPGYIEMSKDSSGMWIKKEKTIGEHLVLQGISLYIEPYTSKNQFEVDSITRGRDRFTINNIQGMRDSSYMAVYNEYIPVEKDVNLNGLYAKEYRGLWNMQNDFMGGPFLHYTVVDEKRNRIIHLDGFVYAPKFNKREYLRELEAIMRTLKIAN